MNSYVGCLKINKQVYHGKLENLKILGTKWKEFQNCSCFIYFLKILNKFGMIKLLIFLKFQF